MADDVRGGVAVGGDEAEVGGLGGPADGVGGVVAVGVGVNDVAAVAGDVSLTFFRDGFGVTYYWPLATIPET